MHLARIRPRSLVFLAARCKLFGTNNIRIAAGDRTEMQQLLAVAHRNGQCLVNMHPANRIADQTSRPIPRRWLTGGIRALLPVCGVLQQRAEKAAQQPSAPGNYEQPKQKPEDARKKCHGMETLYRAGTP